MTPVRRAALAIACVLLLPAGMLRAQCPDGTPPPCRGAVARRAAPALDARTWIVVPFANIARAPDIEWLRDASVNLLSLDMSRWQDIRVVDDGRVTRLVRDLPEATRAQLDLDAALGVARRAGAGMLVTGDLLKEGARTVIVGKVFDVRSGRRLRTVQAQMTGTDSLTGTFGRLARSVLDVPPPAGSQLGALGTASIEAYREYLIGTTALSAFNIPEATQRLSHAIEIDSGFALAHYKLAIALGWRAPNEPGIRVHAEAAARLSGALPPRERTLITGELAMAQGEYGRSCETYGPLVRADSSDVEALYGLGECSFHDMMVLPVAGDTTRFVFRSSWSTSIRVFQRVLELDPTYHLAFQHIGDALSMGARPGCRPRAGQAACAAADQTWAAAVLRVGDSLQTVPVSVTDGGVALSAQQLEAQRTSSARRNLQVSREIIERWVAAGPAEPRAHIAYGSVLLRLGDVGAADREARRAVGPLGPLDRVQLAHLRVDVAVKLDRPDSVQTLLDSMVADTSPAVRSNGIVLEVMFGRLRRLDSLVAAAPAAQAPPSVKRYFAVATRALLGLPADSLADAERGLLPLLAAAGPARSALTLAASLAYGPLDRAPGDWPITDTASADWRLRLVSVLATGDTARFGRALTTFDSSVAAQPDNPDAGYTYLSARAHLLRSDTTGALRQLTSFADSTWRVTPALAAVGALQPAYAGMLWPREFLLMGDLLAAKGRKQDAAQAYRRVVGLWSRGDPEVQPIVTRAREALARLGN